MSFLAHMSFYGNFFRARLHIGYLAFPFVILGFGAHWALLSFDLNILFKLDQSGAWWRFIFASIIAFFYMPFVFIVNDYFDAPFDALDGKKRDRNPFASKQFSNRTFAKIFITILAVVPLILGFLISIEAGIVTVIALFLGYFYSAPPLRFKSTAIADFLVHGFCLGVYFFSLGFFSFFRKNFNAFTEPLFLLLLVFTMVDAAWIHLDSALKDYFVDKEGNQSTTAVVLGRNNTIYIIHLMIIFLIISTPIFFLINENLIDKFGYIFTISLIGVILIVPLSYLLLFYLLKNKIEQKRILSARYRVWCVYPFTIIAVFLSNPLIYV